METTVLTVIIHPIEIVSLIHSFIHLFIQKVTFVFYPSKTAVQAAKGSEFLKLFQPENAFIFTKYGKPWLRFNNFLTLF